VLVFEKEGGVCLLHFSRDDRGRKRGTTHPVWGAGKRGGGEKERGSSAFSVFRAGKRLILGARKKRVRLLATIVMHRAKRKGGKSAS